MDFEDQEEHDEEMEMAASYDSLGNSGSGRVKMPSSGGGQVEGLVAQPRKPRYRECLKNHAVGMGGHALDGCGEFLAAGAEGTLDALKCAACSCHRNFHRKETESVGPSGGLTGAEPPYGGPLVPHYPHPQFSPYYRSPTGYLHVAPHHRPLALPSTSGGGAGSHSREDQEDVSNPSGGGGGGGGGSGYGFGSGSSNKKRFRTKFSQEQKERMLGLAERLGWRIQKQDDELVQQFCNETGVKRHVLKVWMHNNKHTLGKKP
ncbi:Octamer-binding transcription factor [Parasponia andersonii]|uniref:Octamer-binding transcription factor n=1 Tax=Parasponia andersonii TaxID=3476 RepID=A0A2P5ADF1_PARAD|nr:Octamer-binding transcription factor [Parasponia andersonii]